MLSTTDGPKTLNLWEFQQNALDRLRDGFVAGHRRQMLYSATGSGKTEIAIKMIDLVRRNDKKVVFACDRIALVDQTSARLAEYGIPHGVAQGGNTYGRYEPVQVASMQTIEKRGYWPDLDLLIYDEAHTVREKIVQFMKSSDVRTIGLSASPLTEGLADIYSNVVNAATTRWLLDNVNEATGSPYLAPLEIYCATPVNVDNLPNKQEWSGRDVEGEVIKITGDIVADWVKHTNKVFGGPVKTLAFTATVRDGAMLRDDFAAAGYRFEQISYRDRDDAGRKAKIDAFRRGEIHGLISCEALAKGFDVPDALCLISARPYKSSLASHIQQLGRVMRASPGKEFALLLDHAGNYLRFAYQLEHFWDIGCTTLAPAFVKRVKERREEQKERKCYGCGFVLEKGVDLCPKCGLTRISKSKKTDTEYVPGDMVYYRSVKNEIGDFWPHISRLAFERRKSIRWARAQYKSVTGAWPHPYGRPLDPNDGCDPRVALAVAENERAYRNRRQRDAYARRRDR